MKKITLIAIALGLLTNIIVFRFDRLVRYEPPTTNYFSRIEPSAGVCSSVLTPKETDYSKTTFRAGLPFAAKNVVSSFADPCAEPAQKSFGERQYDQYNMWALKSWQYYLDVLFWVFVWFSLIVLIKKNYAHIRY